MLVVVIVLLALFLTTLRRHDEGLEDHGGKLCLCYRQSGEDHRCAVTDLCAVNVETHARAEVRGRVAVGARVCADEAHEPTDRRGLYQCG